MPDFAYLARDLNGKSIAGTISANNQRDAAAQLGARSLFPVSITVNKGSQVKSTRRVSGTQMAGFYEQLASLLRSGVPLLRALSVLSTQGGTSKTLRFAVSEIKAKVEEGESLGDAMARFPRVFNDIGVNMVKAGSEGGFLPCVCYDGRCFSRDRFANFLRTAIRCHFCFHASQRGIASGDGGTVGDQSYRQRVLVDRFGHVRIGRFRDQSVSQDR